jgi:hypothetical protein
MIWRIARRAIDWFIVADAKDGDDGNEGWDKEYENCEVLCESRFTYS